MAIEVCPICKQRDHSSKKQLLECYKKFRESLDLVD